MEDFSVHNFRFYNGTNFYLDFQAFAFNLYLDPTGYKVDYYKDKVLRFLPELGNDFPENLADLYAAALIQTIKLDLDLIADKYKTILLDDGYIVAVEYVEEETTIKAVQLVSSWFRAMNENSIFDYKAELSKLRKFYHTTAFGDPVMYSVIVEGVKRNIPVQLNQAEQEFQWGHGQNQLRGIAESFHTDSYKDTLFIKNKVACYNFLKKCDSPVPDMEVLYNETSAAKAAEKIGFPVMLKTLDPDNPLLIEADLSSAKEVEAAYRKIIGAQKKYGLNKPEVIVQKQLPGKNYRILLISGIFVSALHICPAMITGNGRSSIKDLIIKENLKSDRSDNPRAPLSKIILNEEVIEYLEKQKYTLYSKPEKGEAVYFQKIPDLNKGAVTIDVNSEIHPDNIAMAQNIAKYWNITCLTIDIIAEDISLSWKDSPFGIINVKPGNEIYAHMNPAFGNRIDVPGLILDKYFPGNCRGRIPLVTGNKITLDFCNTIYEKLCDKYEDVELGCLVDEGIFFNGIFFSKSEDRISNIKLLFRNPKLNIAVINHHSSDIMEHGCFHKGADMVILDNADDKENIMKRDLLPEAICIERSQNVISATKCNHEKPELIPMEQFSKDSSPFKIALELIDEIIRRYSLFKLK